MALDPAALTRHDMLVLVVAAALLTDSVTVY